MLICWFASLLNGLFVCVCLCALPLPKTINPYLFSQLKFINSVDWSQLWSCLFIIFLIKQNEEMASIPIAMSEVSISSSSSSAESELSTREDITVLTNYVKALRESLAKIKRIFNPTERGRTSTIIWQIFSWFHDSVETQKHVIHCNKSHNL